MSYICEKCGKVVNVKFGSGRFCSRACANSRIQTEETNQKRSNSVKLAMPRKKIVLTCKVCGKQFEPKCGKNGFPNPYVKTCSIDCLKKLKSINAKGNKGGGFRAGSAKNYKYGYFNNISCDSSWELAYLVYCIDNQINIKRNTEPFSYIYENKIRKYYPDFIINDDTYVEIKNYKTDIVIEKQKQFPKDKKYKILFQKDLIKYLNYCITKYGKNFTEVLYQKDKPSYLNKKGSMV